jgi:hypothetical protein
VSIPELPFRYRVYEPETPRELPLELVQEWESAIPLTLGALVRDDGTTWVVATLEADAEPDITGRIYFDVAPPER